MPNQSDLSHANRLHDLLRREITAGLIAAGTRIREAEVAERFGVSRTPVREALKKLESEGLVISIPRRGLTVVQPTLDDVVDTYAVRERVEGLAIRFAAERALATEMMQMDRIVLHLQAAHDANDPDRFFEWMLRFDETMFQCARSRILVRMIEAARNAPGVVIQRANLVHAERRLGSMSARRAMLSAIRARQPDAAEEILRDFSRYREAALPSNRGVAWFHGQDPPTLGRAARVLGNWDRAATPRNNRGSPAAQRRTI
jgi:DNA-binding GntR family transcriptional regulator